MANLTLSIDDKLLQAARVRAVKEGTSVNEICRQAIENYARANSNGFLRRFDAMMAKIDARAAERGPALPTPWKTRDEMYEQMFEERSTPASPKPSRNKS